MRDALRQRIGRGERVAGQGDIGYRLVDADLRRDFLLNTRLQ